MTRPSLQEIYNSTSGNTANSMPVSNSYTPTSTGTQPVQPSQGMGGKPSLSEIYNKYQSESPQPTNVQSQVPTPQPAPTSLMGDIGTSLKENIIDPFTSRFSNIDYNNQNFGSNILQSVGALAGGAVDVAGKALVEGAKVFTPKPVEQMVGNTVDAFGQGISSAIPDSTKQAIANWASQHPEAAANLGAFVDIASIIPVGKAVSATKTALGVGIGKEVAETSASRILQATKPTLEKTQTAVKAYTDIPLNEVRTYSDLEKVLQKKNSTDLAEVTSKLSKDTTPYRLQNFEVNKNGIKFNPVSDAIKTLHSLAVNTSDSKLMGELNRFGTVTKSGVKLSTDTIIKNDVNELAKLMGKYANSFKDAGGLLKGEKYIKAENIRKELKNIARTGMSKDVADLDMAVSNRIEVAKLATRMSQKVANELNKAEQVGVFKKLIGFGLKTTDLLSGRILSTAIRELTRRGTLSAVELEKELVKNLKTIQQINKLKDVNKAKEFLKGMGYFGASQVINTQSDTQPQQ